MKAILKNATVDNDNAEHIDFAQTIDFTELFDHIKTFAGIECKFYQPEITTKHGKVYISFMSDDVTAQTGLYAAILKCCYIQSASSGVYMGEELCYWVSVNVRYEHKNGGFNGMEMVFAVYCRGKWTFYNTGQERSG